MATVADVMTHILAEYPHKTDLSNARLTKLVYLTDWVHAIRQNRQVTPIVWYFDNYGPFVWDVLDTAKGNPDRFAVEYTSNYYGTPKALVRLAAPGADGASLSESEREAADHVIRETQSLNWDSFIKLVYSTHPILTSDRYTRLDLVEKAKEYREQSQVAPA